MNRIEPMRQYLDEKAKFPKENGAKQPDKNILTVIELFFAVFIILLIIGKFIQ